MDNNFFIYNLILNRPVNDCYSFVCPKECPTVPNLSRSRGETALFYYSTFCAGNAK